MTAVDLTQAAAGAPLDLSFTTSSLPLLDDIFRRQHNAGGIPALTLSVRAMGRRPSLRRGADVQLLGASVGSFTENLSGPISGTATLVVRPR